MSEIKTAPHQDWLVRTRLVASLIPEGTRVIEFGCGAMKLADALGDRCVYLGYDKADFDLESKDWPIIPSHDVAVLCGVLEWLEKPSAVIARMVAPTLIVTYDFSLKRAWDWKSHLTLSEFEFMIQFNQYRIDATKAWIDQTIFRCKR